MGKSTFNIIYVIQKGKAKADGSAPVVARITVNGEKSHFATRIYVDPACWLPKEYRTTGMTREERKVNEALDELRVLIKQRHDEMLRRAEVITAGKLKNAITGLDEKAMKLLDLCDRFIEDYKGLVEAKVYGRKTLTRYVSTRNRLSKFIAERYRLQDIPLSDMNPKFAKDFDLLAPHDKAAGQQHIDEVCPAAQDHLSHGRNERLGAERPAGVGADSDGEGRSRLPHDRGAEASARQEIQQQAAGADTRPVSVLLLHGVRVCRPEAPVVGHAPPLA